jgi:hypothetical protein
MLLRALVPMRGPVLPRSGELDKITNISAITKRNMWELWVHLCSSDAAASVKRLFEHASWGLLPDLIESYQTDVLFQNVVWTYTNVMYIHSCGVDGACKHGALHTSECSMHGQAIINKLSRHDRVCVNEASMSAPCVVETR